MGRVCEFAECIETKKGYKTICSVLGYECHTNHLDAEWCKDWKENKEFIQFTKEVLNGR